MPQQGIPPYLSYRVVDVNTGAVVVADLPHLHQSRWTVRALLGGLSGGATLGDFTIPMPGPLSKDFQRSDALFRKLALGQRIEGYLGTDPETVPRLSGIITRLSQPLDANWEIGGVDYLWVLQQSQLFPGESIGAVNGVTRPMSDVVKALCGTVEVLWDDDFSGYGGLIHPNSSDYTATGTWTATTDSVFGLPCIQGTAASQGWLIATHTAFNTTSHYTVNQVNGAAACRITAQGVIDVTNNNNSTQAGDFAIIIDQNDGTTQRFLALARMRWTGTDANGNALYAIDTYILSETSGGVFTTRANVNNVFTNVFNKFVFSMEVTIDNSQGIHLFINGKDTGAKWVPDVTLLAATGFIGVWSQSVVATNYTVSYNKLKFEARTSQTFAAGGAFNQTGWGTNRFQQGSISASAMNLPQLLSAANQTYLDLLLIGSSFDGFNLRKNPRAGYKSDTLDYGAALGSDLSAQIIFEEGINLERCQVTVAPDVFATATKVNTTASGATDTGGSLTWSPVSAFYGAADSPLVLVDSSSDIGIPGFVLLYRYAKQLAQRKANPLQAIEAVVVRTADTADKWREWDSVTIDVPSLGLFRQKAQVISYTLQEGDTRQTVQFNQFPASLLQQPVQQLQRSVEFLTGTYVSR